VPPLEAWEKVIITGNDGEEFLESIHGSIDCITCHGGVADTSKEVAHQGMIRDPSQNPEESCGGAGCHDGIVAATETSIHTNLTGYRTMIAIRTGIDLEDDDALRNGFNQSCNNCHTTCGQCHVSRPHSVEGGLVSDHKFERSPSMINQCTACHGSRVGDEYRGKHRETIPGYKFDVHYGRNAALGGKHCANCHTADEMHNGSGDYRYAVMEMPRCEDCHGNEQSSNTYHSVHWGDLSCQVCHSQDYKNCDACHVGEGLESPSYLTFKIGKNPLPNDRSYKYVTLRHVPIAEDTYAGWGYGGGLPNFDVLPTWKLTTPHNIQRWTARTDTTGGRECKDACHESPPTLEGFFFRQVDLGRHPDEENANASLIVPDAPPSEWGD
jgi:thiosulfate/3-mercaptopyruvate sulfurtransferase